MLLVAPIRGDCLFGSFFPMRTYLHCDMIVGEIGFIQDATHGCYINQQEGAEPKPYSQLISNQNNLSKIGIVIEIHTEYEESKHPEEEFGPKADSSFIAMRMLDGLVIKFMWNGNIHRYVQDNGNQIIWNVTPKRYGVHYNIWSNYGGAEEGGWWYDNMAPYDAKTFSLEDSENDAYTNWYREQNQVPDNFGRGGEFVSFESHPNGGDNTYLARPIYN
jgi:hypothetical protein